MQVLDHQHDGVLGAELLEQGEERFEEPALSSTDVLGLDRWQRGKAEAGEEACQLGARAVGERVERGVAIARQWSQRGDDGGVGQLALPELDAVARKEAAARRLARRAASSRIRVFPTPDSPATKTSDGRPAAASVSAASSSASSAVRPIIRLDVILAATAPVSPLACDVIGVRDDHLGGERCVHLSSLHWVT